MKILLGDFNAKVGREGIFKPTIEFPNYHMKILLGDFNAEVGREDIFKPTIGNESLDEIRNDNGVRVVNFATSKILTVRSTMFPHCNIHKFTWALNYRIIVNTIQCDSICRYLLALHVSTN
jgi:hypothetical protein